MPEFLQQARGASALSSGLTTFPGAIGLLISAQIAARRYARIGPRRMAVFGLLGVLIVWTLIGLTVGVDTNIWLIRVLTFCSGAASGWCVIAIQTSAFSTISSADTGRGAALFQTQSRISGGVGVAVLVTVVAAASPHGAHEATGAVLVPAFHLAFLTAAAIAAAGTLVALTIRDTDAAATMGTRQRVAAPAPPAAAVPPGIGEGTADAG
jgi:MFS family permease